MSRTRLVPLFLALFATALIAGCGSDSSDDESTGTTTGTTTATVTAADCTPENLTTYKDGVLTVGTDSPAYSPYFEDDDPTNGKGFESAVAYAMADQLGFDRSTVEWTTVPFNSSYAPGPKKFDFDVNQISITPKRAEVVDFSTPYYTASQGVLVAKGSDLEGITSLGDLKDATIGVQIGTTSLEAVNDEIEPSTDPKVFDTSNDVVAALKSGQVDAIVVDLPTAIFLRDAIVSGSSVVGQFDAPGGDEFGALLAKDSEMTGCVDFALEALKEDGTLEELTRQWMSDAASAPELS
jgi:polar amino acid transport system substrate-binding protein